ncbi:MaoC/PaaZ C-terminal domain-containing protein [Streptomyces tsukubensis]|uniref:3-alpha,7-alpha, 12-alpha-trihydroxy-5-beta-cholest-24-enoyl-CoA hydratase n=1 Tax=Streptomyces tsukubensis TaxID=83656 RepID=A0A1V4A6Q8_9ACTN|nr:MaoC/PaaZ C-terminal domain-containing protein [Streptomyces tsukubensis]OON76714.1 3-alpha,7-alpha,12-alpha-trihydroxy-5-beta-cholest-24-enoyl-CoA hydratase [Streptomyces tsukubensis]QFR93318.1 3-alpha,7-alpha,12-alpha-trihydroxy-5-beta-cholest-24-enoyl-CoA hydratase [Streptomyces tsukubensis]
MPIDPAKALAAPPKTEKISWEPTDVLLYHLGLGAGTPATDPVELRYTLESRLHVLPSFATVAGVGAGVTGGLDTPGIDVDLSAVLHGTQHIGIHRPLPARGEATATTAVVAVHDKGSAAVVVQRTEAADGEGPLWTAESRLFVRGEGGFGGERGASLTSEDLPATEPDFTVERGVREDQALLYRLSGDRNPLHADPRFAARAGFERPILHGLCTYGMALKAAVDTALDGEPERVRGYGARFTGVVFPGETLRIRIWRVRPGALLLSVTVAERADTVVLADAVVEYD